MSHALRRRRRLFFHEVRELARIAGPIVVAQLGGIAMNTTDTIMVGRLGATALAAAGIATAVQFALIVVCNGVVMGMSPLVSQAFGAGDREECRRVLVQGLWLAAALAIPGTLLSMSGRQVSLLLGQAPEVALLAGDYLTALAPGVLPLLLFMAFRQYLEGMGVSRPAMWLSFVGVALNVVGNWVLIWGVPGVVRPLGVVGSGIATSAVRWAMPIGTMKDKAAIWIAIWWAASEAVPMIPIRNTAALKMPTSSVSVTAIGRPRRHTSRKRNQSGRQKRPNRW